MNNMKQMICPKCGGRAFDISKIPKEQIEVELKCPRCRNVIMVNFSHEFNRVHTKDESAE